MSGDLALRLVRATKVDRERARAIFRLEAGDKVGPISDTNPLVQALALARLAERERCAQIAYRVCAETRHVSLARAIEAEIRKEDDQ